ncbi:MAG: FlgD immunoglobulin-like domain containing protein, partial [bacterium]
TPNNAWWCGENLPSCGGGDPAGGYGNSYEEYLDYWAEIASDLVATSITVNAILNYDNEPGYDYLYLQYETVSGLQNAATYNGADTGLAVNLGLNFAAGDYVPHPDTGNPSCHIRWYGSSDGAWSDADCDYPTVGLAQIDNITVSGDNGVVTAFEDNEDANPADNLWRATIPQGVGAFCWTWGLLDEIDECCHNDSPQIAFVDDGNVVPGTGGSVGLSWNYGPDGYVVNAVGGLAGPSYHLHNEVWSPVLEWPATPGYDGGFIEFTVFRHFLLGPVWAGMFYRWGVRSTAGDPEEIEDEYWRDRSFVYYGGPDCVRTRHVISDLLEPGRTYVQLALGIYELGWAWGWEGTDAAPAPYFDDARFCAFEFDGPAISTREIDIAQDDFPENGDITCGQPCDMHVRFDMARDVSLRSELFMYFGDSITFDIVAVRTGTELAAMPELCYRLDPNPLFDTCRSAIPAGTGNTSFRGVTPGDSCRSTGPSGGDVIRDRFFFDLPDTGFFYPGDYIHYYIRAADTGGGTTTLPGDTSGFSHFPCRNDPDYRFLQYPSSYVVRALPSILDLPTCAHPQILWWNDFANRGLEPEWMWSWTAMGFQERCNFDIYYTNGPSSGVGNGLGGRATSTQLLGYDMIAYSSGDLDQFTITDVDYEDDGGNDIGVLEGWFDTGDKCLFLTGNDLVNDLNNRSAATVAWENKYIQVELVDISHGDLLELWNPTVQRYPDDLTNPVFHCATRWLADGYCNPILRHFDLVNAEGSPGLVAEFLTENCETGQYQFAAAVYNNDISGIEGGQVIYLPYDLGYVAHDSRCGGNQGTCYVGGAVRAEILRDVLHRCDFTMGTPPYPAVPEAMGFAVDANYPNPFNPSTRITYRMPRSGTLTISIYNVRGELVKQLIDEVVEAGEGFVVWDGTGDDGAEVSSGVYFYKTTALGKTSIQKMALVR